MSFRVSRPPAPWLSRDLRHPISHLNALFSRTKRSRSLHDLAVYGKYSEVLNRELTNAKNNFYLERINDISDPNKVWIELASLGLVKSSYSSPLHFFCPDDLNKFYSAVSSKLPPCTVEGYRSAVLPIQADQTLLFKFTSISPTQVTSLITFHAGSSLFSSGPDAIPLFAIRESL